MKSCKTIIDERLDIANFIQDSVDFQIFKQLFLSSRHKLLIPLVTINLTQKKNKAPFGNISAFERNLRERTDFPVFSIDDAVNQVKTHALKTDLLGTNIIQKEMDLFFIKYLPWDILKMENVEKEG